MEVFWSNGYYDTSLPDLLQATGLSRSSLYGTFGDKHGLFLHALDRYITDALTRLDSELDPQRDAWEGLRLFLAGYVRRNGGSLGRKGCLVVATAMELSAKDAEVEKRIRGFFRAVEGQLTKAFERAKKEGSLADGVVPQDAARILLAVVEGLRVIAKTGIDNKLWQASIDSLLFQFAK
jgi:TetR/AcrR family transcriptional repressor of nem operon